MKEMKLRASDAEVVVRFWPHTTVMEASRAQEAAPIFEMLRATSSMNPSSASEFQLNSFDGTRNALIAS